jgi:putative ABC transport system permease protein
MLLGEQALLAGISIPLGFLLGYGICALLVHAMQSDLYRMPLIISRQTYAITFLAVAAASALSSLLIVWRLRRLDLVSVLKARE